MVLQLTPPGAEPVDTGSMVMKADGDSSAVTSSRQPTTTATIAAIRSTLSVVIFTAPNG